MGGQVEYSLAQWEEGPRSIRAKLLSQPQDNQFKHQPKGFVLVSKGTGLARLTGSGLMAQTAGQRPAPVNRKLGEGEVGLVYAVLRGMVEGEGV